jgi:hypothetical protein
MGTSASHPSPKTTAWRTVGTCYESDQIPVDRTAEEIWQAATSESSTIEAQLKSPAVYACYDIARQGIAPDQVHVALSRISSEHKNSMVVEYARRATLVASQSPRSAEEWPKLFFKEVTNYLVSRDASGYISPTSRSKTVGDLIRLKRSIGSAVEKRIGDIRLSARNENEWRGAVSTALQALRPTP